jgi:hypothetical protein
MASERRPGACLAPPGGTAVRMNGSTADPGRAPRRGRLRAPGRRVPPGGRRRRTRAAVGAHRLRPTRPRHLDPSRRPARRLPRRTLPCRRHHPRLHAAFDQLVGVGRWTPLGGPGGAASPTPTNRATTAGTSRAASPSATGSASTRAPTAARCCSCSPTWAPTTLPPACASARTSTSDRCWPPPATRTPSPSRSHPRRWRPPSTDPSRTPPATRATSTSVTVPRARRATTPGDGSEVHGPAAVAAGGPSRSGQSPSTRRAGDESRPPLPQTLTRGVAS